jgi:hypothetical protein
MERIPKFNLQEKYDKSSGNWYCISCERKVARHNNNQSQVHLMRSYFIQVTPFNARICSQCLAKTIKIGTTDLDLSRLTRKEYNRLHG